MRKLSEDYRWVYLGLLALLVGFVGGLGAVVFRDLVQISADLFREPLSYAPSPYFIALLPVLGGLIVGFMVYTLAPEARGDGIPHIMEALQRKGGRIRKRVGVIIVLTSAITLGSGGSAGREGPIALIGASFGSVIGQLMRLGSSEVKVLTACGVAAAISGTFNAPMGGAIFSMEVISKRFSSADAVPILLAAVVGKAVATSFIEPAPEFINPRFVFSTTDLAACFLMGPLFGAMAAVWVKTYYAFEDLFNWIPVDNKFKPALGGIVAGISGIYLYEYGIMGVGYEGVNKVFQMTATDTSNQILFLIVTLGLVKILATAFTVGSGGSGGLFAPTLYIGSMFGVLFGILTGRTFPGMIAEPSDYGLLGMGAFFAGAAGAPLTCIVMIPEISSNYSGLPPLIVCCVLSYTMTQFLLERGSLYTIKLMRKGIYVDFQEPVLRRVSVGEAMNEEVVTVSSGTTVSKVREEIFRYNYSGFPVVDDDGLLWGMITFDDIRKVPKELHDKLTTGDVAVKNVITVYPDQSVFHAMDIMYKNGIGRLPVVSRENPRQLLGIITRTDTITAYEKETRQAEKSLMGSP